MKLVYSVQKLVTLTASVLADRFVHAVNVAQNVILVRAQQDNYARTELVLPVAVRIWIVPAIGRASMVNAWILVSEIMPVERMLYVKYPNTEQFACVPMASKVNQSKDVHHTNVKRMMTVNTINYVTMDHVKILAYNPALVVLMPSVAL